MKALILTDVADTSKPFIHQIADFLRSAEVEPLIMAYDNDYRALFESEGHGIGVVLADTSKIHGRNPIQALRRNISGTPVLGFSSTSVLDQGRHNHASYNAEQLADLFSIRAYVRYEDGAQAIVARALEIASPPKGPNLADELYPSNGS
ncbi:MAG: hypothetical protein KDI46_03610 [Alphaproteobacteria bacterium]|nr:hypothetical protein [Alphaproteobacteria bacterium]